MVSVERGGGGNGGMLDRARFCPPAQLTVRHVNDQPHRHDNTDLDRYRTGFIARTRDQVRSARRLLSSVAAAARSAVAS